MPGGGARLSLGVRATVAKRWAFGRSVSASSSLSGAAAALPPLLDSALGSSGEGAGPAVGRVGREEAVKAAGRGGGKMPLAQLADPWQKMAVESPSDSAEVSAVGRRGRRAPSPRPRWLALAPFPGATPSTSFPGSGSGSHLVPSVGFRFGSLGFDDLSILLSRTLTSACFFGWWGAASVVARGVWSGR